jgi:hypothetical protein
MDAACGGFASHWPVSETPTPPKATRVNPVLFWVWVPLLLVNVLKG